MTTQTETRLVLGRSLRFWGITFTIVGVVAIYVGLRLIAHGIEGQFQTLAPPINPEDRVSRPDTDTADLFMIGGFAVGFAGLLTTITGMWLWVRSRHG